jgi:MFS family permease
MPIRSPSPSSSPTSSPALSAPLAGRSLLANPAFRKVLYTQACFGMAYSTFMILPKYLATQGVGPGRMSLIMGTASAMNVVAAPLVSWLGRALSPHRGFILANLTMALGAAGFAVVDPGAGGFAPYLFRAIQGLAWALMFSSASLLVFQLAPRGRLGEAIALHSSANLASSALGPALAEAALATMGPRPVFLVAAATALVAAWLAGGIDRGRAGSAGGPTPAPGERPGTVLLLISVVLGIACGAMLVFHQPLALARGITRVSDFLVAYTAGALFSRLGLGRLGDRIGTARVAFASFLLYGVVVAAMPALRGPSWLGGLAMFGAVFGLAHGLFWPAFLTLSLASGGPGSAAGRERLLAWINAGFNLGVAAAGGLGIVAERGGYALVFIPVGILTAASALLLWRWASAGGESELTGPTPAHSAGPVAKGA